MKKEEITVEDVISFIVQNSDETERMDKINRITFPFTSKYENFSKETQYIPYRKIDKTKKFLYDEDV